MTILADACGFVRCDAKASADRLHVGLDLLVARWGHDQLDGLADRFVRQVPVHPLGACVPGQDGAIQCLTENRIVAGFDDRHDKLLALATRRFGL